MATLRDLTIRIKPEVDSAGFRRIDRGLDDVAKSAVVATRRMLTMTTAVGNLIAKFATFALQKTRDVLSGIATGFAESADAGAKLSTATGVGVEAIQELGFAVQFSGGSQEDLNKALIATQKQIGLASAGSKEIKKSFKDLGIEFKDLEKLTPEQQILRIADGFKTLPAGAQRSSLALKLFEESGVRLLPFLTAGSDGIEKMRNEARQLGGVFSTQTARGAENFNDAMLRLRIALGGVRNRLASQLLPALTKIIEKFNDFIKEGDRAKVFLDRVSAAVKGIGLALASLAAVSIAKTFAGFFTLGPTVIVFAALAFGISQVAKLLKGDENLISSFLGDKDAVDGLRTSFEGVVSSLKAAAAAILPALSQVVAALAPIIASIAVTLAGVLSDLAPVIASVVTQLAPVIATVLVLISGVIKDLQPLINGLLESFSQIVKELLPVLQELFAALAPIVKDLVKALGPVFKIFIKIFAFRILTMIRVFAFALKLLKPIINVISRALKDLGPAAEATFGLMEKAISAVGRALAPIVALFKEIAKRISAAGKAVKEFVGDVKKIPGVGAILRFAAPESQGGTRARGRLVGGGGATAAVQGLRSQRIQGVTTGPTTTTAQTTNVGGVTVNVKSQASPAEIGTVLERTIKDLRRRAMEDISPSSRSALKAALK